MAPIKVKAFGLEWCNPSIGFWKLIIAADIILIYFCQIQVWINYTVNKNTTLSAFHSKLWKRPLNGHRQLNLKTFIGWCPEYLAVAGLYSFIGFCLETETVVSEHASLVKNQRCSVEMSFHLMTKTSINYCCKITHCECADDLYLIIIIIWYNLSVHLFFKNRFINIFQDCWYKW